MLPAIMLINAPLATNTLTFTADAHEAASIVLLLVFLAKAIFHGTSCAHSVNVSVARLTAQVTPPMKTLIDPWWSMAPLPSPLFPCPNRWKTNKLHSALRPPLACIDDPPRRQSPPSELIPILADMAKWGPISDPSYFSSLPLKDLTNLSNYGHAKAFSLGVNICDLIQSLMHA